MFTVTHRAQVRSLAATLLALAALTGVCTAGEARLPNERGRELAAFLQAMNVDSLWLPQRYVDWRTGRELQPAPEEARRLRLPKSSHCSDFAAAAAERLGVVLPDASTSPFGHVLLANAQNAWLNSPEAARHGWERLASAGSAQALANQGYFVVASVAGATPRKPGHIAVVVPHEAAPGDLEANGPYIAQAGSKANPKLPSGNAALTRVRIGFWLHTRGDLSSVEYYAAPVRGAFPAL